MNKQTSKEQLLRQYVRSIIKEALLAEKFASPTLAQFAQMISSQNKLEINKVLRGFGVAWDQIPEESVTLEQSGQGSMVLKKAINDKTKIIIWTSPDKQQLVHWKPTTYTKWGSKRDNSIYLRPNTVVVSQGKNFLTGYGNLTLRNMATNRYDKPLDGGLSVTKLAIELEAIALIIDVAAVKSADTTQLQRSRATSKSGATAMQSAADILSANQRRYQSLLVQSKKNKFTEAMTARVTAAVEKLKANIESAAQTTAANLISYRDRSYGGNDEFPLTKSRADVGKIDYIALQNAATKYNDLIDLYSDYITAANNYVRSGQENYYRKYVDSATQALEKVLSEVE